MSYTAIQDTPILVDLTQVARTTGWTMDGTKATHESCNAGNIRLFGYNVISGLAYIVSYKINSISGGYVQLKAGNTNGVQRTTTGYIQETIVPTGSNPFIFFTSNANCEIEAFNIETPRQAAGVKNKNTIAYSWEKKKWHTFLTFTPDIGFSLFTNSYTIYGGDLYKHDVANASRNNFYGTQYDTIVNLPSNVQPASVHSLESLSYQSNQLLITTTDGIKTSLGQVSELGGMDFLKDILDDTIIQVSVYNKEGVYSACFLKDKNEDLINGSPLKGNYATVELTTTTGNNNKLLRLFTVVIVTAISKVGAR